MVGLHFTLILPIPISNYDMAGIKIYQRSRLWSISIFSHTKNASKVRHSNRKTIKYYQETFKFTLPWMQLFIHIYNQNHTSKLSLTWILKTDLTLYFPWVITLEVLYPNLKTLWFSFALTKGKLYHNSTLDLFNQEDIFLLNDKTRQTDNLKNKYIT